MLQVCKHCLSVSQSVKWSVCVCLYVSARLSGNSSPYHHNLFLSCGGDNTVRVYSVLQVGSVLDLMSVDLLPFLLVEIIQELMI